MTLSPDIMGVCRNCGDPFHVEEQCPKTPAMPRCPVCGAGTYWHRSDVLACSNSGCSWADLEAPRGPFDIKVAKETYDGVTRRLE